MKKESLNAQKLMLKKIKVSRLTGLDKIYGRGTSLGDASNNGPECEDYPTHTMGIECTRGRTNTPRCKSFNG